MSQLRYIRITSSLEALNYYTTGWIEKSNSSPDRSRGPFSHQITRNGEKDLIDINEANV